MKNKGQSTVEALLSLLLAFSSIGLIAFSLMFGTLSIWVDHFSYEAAICIKSYPFDYNLCEKNFYKQLQAIWPLGHLHIQRDVNSHFSGYFEFLKWRLNFHQILN